MTLSREEIAVRVNEALLAYVEAHGHSPGCDVSMFVGAEKCNCGYTELAYALRAILLTPTPAPGAPPAGPCPGEDARDDAEACKRIAAAGLAVPPPAPTPAPEAKRPEWVRYVKSGSDAVIARPVLRWEGANPVVPSSDGAKGLDHSYTFHLLPDEWVACDAPAPCPPPVAGSVDPVREAERAVVKAAEALQAADDAYAELYATVKDDDDAHNEARPRLDQLHAARLNRRFDLTDAVRALRTSRPVRP